MDKIRADIKTPTGKSSATTVIKYYYIIHHLNYYHALRRDTYMKGVPMNSTLLTELFSTSSIVSEVMRYLISNKFIRKVKTHQPGEKSSLYQLHENLLCEPVYQIDFDASDSALIRRLEFRANDIKYFHKQLQILKDKIRVNQFGIDYLKSKYGELPISLSQIAMDPVDVGLFHIYYGLFSATRPDLESRVYTNMTNLPRIHRPFIDFDGQPMMMTDISNSQILLTVPLLHNCWSKKSGRGLFGLPQDVTDFRLLAESGQFYEHMASQLNLSFKTESDRSEFKKRVFAEIWFSKNSNRQTKIKSVFMTTFPTVYEIIWQLKRSDPDKDHSQFAIALQRFEAKLIVDNVWMKMVKMKKCVLTLHDAIICTNREDLKLAEELIRESCLKHRINPSFKNDDYAKIIVQSLTNSA